MNQITRYWESGYIESGASFLLHFIAIAFLRYHKSKADFLKCTLLFEFGGVLLLKDGKRFEWSEHGNGRLHPLKLLMVNRNFLKLDLWSWHMRSSCLGILVVGERRRIGCQEGMGCFSRRPSPPHCCSSPRTRRCGPDPQSPTRDRGLRSNRVGH